MQQHSSRTAVDSNDVNACTVSARQLLLVNGDANRVNGAILCPKSAVSKLSYYIYALRPWSFSTSLTPVALGAALAYKTTNRFDALLFLLTLVTVMAVHGAGNLVNTYYDYVKGIDKKDKCDDTTLVDRKLTVDDVNFTAIVLYVSGCVGCSLIALLSPARMVHLALVYFGGLSCSFMYTGGIGLKYIALGDVIVLTIFGPISVLFSFMSQTGTWDLMCILYALPLAMNTEAILHSNNTRDMENDRKAGAVTIPILIGATCSHILFAILLLVPYIFFFVIGFHFNRWLMLPLITIPKAFQIERDFRNGQLQKIPKTTAKLNFYFGLFYVIAVGMSHPNNLPGISVR
ncbi:ubiA prenyltransferase domain-containing protein 1-like protein [Leptotrombidium deliense]|uniref:UbiA prenyltransferase domain-containing protein 1-like protein n=1 Tax=Leptotrombidium deliense TaxID=299467 RepID=A0A443SQW1_9ACAR|nr:ubiA prenyltransferase domain-containing protein 1-like protein [Leptotrombidium deliense]